MNKRENHSIEISSFEMYQIESKKPIWTQYTLKRPTVDLKVNDIMLTFLLDNGSQVSIINKEDWRRIKDEYTLRKIDNLTSKSANQSKVDIKGWVRIRL